MKKNEYAIIVAGGKGTRMKSTVPKQFMLLNGLPVLIRTLNTFFSYSKDLNVILVLPDNDLITWQNQCEQYGFDKPVILAPGGDTRFQSVKNGLDKIKDPEGIVAIHDGVRPLVSQDIIGASFHLAAVHGSAVAAVRLKESIRKTDQHKTKAVDRSEYRLIQTPQTFDLKIIKPAYQIKEEPSLTDDASVVEKSGHEISLFEGSYNNLKITTPEDIVIAEALLKS
ncbi:2-C-methyl-D-erythritol 4-phosphate cytidylyltransferase [Fulvivirga sp. M361]|uniref:2-C-methyl-D-erythritol 4-phosphate cytidylyltransferase n=1 Tax=Fulvivirga sp. M361 TaxID=2594266 RepID=UPI00117BAA8A|nr:2-C-methyl-D-erythritol 4-phosphate cytidylyltransferase [Fulvivirga sp. M361]TRX56241.1 2-C-methyl-D-erythritol 4-phosphate cytidylyltransferase [Fulvivirga sp. M361]